MTLLRTSAGSLGFPLSWRLGQSRLWPSAQFHDGISYNADTGRVVIKAAGAAPTITTLTSAFTFTGGNQSRYMGPAGLLVASATNTPRVEYDASGNCLGLLIEGTRTNLWLHSQTFDNASWTKVRSSVSANTIAAPDGTTTADTLVEDGTAANSHLLRQDYASATSGTVYTISVYAKAKERSQILILFGADTAAFSNEGVLFTLSGSGTSAVSTGSPVAHGIQALPNGWYRCRVTATCASTTNAVLRIQLCSSSSSTYSGDGASGLYLWGAQLEAGRFPTSYIPTTTGTVARTADSCIRTLSSEFSATAGTAVVNVGSFMSADVSANQCIASFDDAGANERYTLQRTNTAGAMRLNVFDGGANQASIDGLSVASTAAVRLAYAYAANDFAISGNGGAVVTDGAGTLPTVTRLDLGSRLAGEHLFGHIRRFDYYPERKANTFLQQATAS
jgi:hypothetical protein